MKIEKITLTETKRTQRFLNHNNPVDPVKNENSVHALVFLMSPV
jgi:hypothetical protein